MAFLLPKITPPPPLYPHFKRSQVPLLRPNLSTSPLPNLASPPLADDKIGDHPPSLQKQRRRTDKDEFYLNLGVAVRTLRDDLPSLFLRDLNYDIYRDDITFMDPLNTFHGIENYKLIFWALRFHGRVLFREIGLEIFRVWQPSETMIVVRWELQGVPRVPWEAKGKFQGSSRYKVDRNGKIYEHKVDNLAFDLPRVVKPATVLDLVASPCPASPNLTFRWDAMEDLGSCSWLELYREVRGTLEGKGREGIEGLGALEGLVAGCL